MNMNGRSTLHLITTTDSRRAKLWERIFGTDQLPIMHATPRLQHMQGKADEVLAYDLDASRLTEWQRIRFADHLARIGKRPFSLTIQEVNSGALYPIRDSFDIQVVEPAAQQQSLASLLRRLGGWKRPFLGRFA